jgi:hypothetical protein
MEGLFLRLTHGGARQVPIYVADVNDAIGDIAGWDKPGPKYVPVNGSIDLVYTTTVAKSLETGSIRSFIDNGEISAQFVIGTMLRDAVSGSARWADAEVSTTGVDDGDPDTPFATFSAAMSYLVANVNNAPRDPAVLFVHPGDYSSQDLVIEDEKFEGLAVVAHTRDALVNSIKSTSDNENLQWLYLRGLVAQSPCEFSCPTDQTHVMGQLGWLFELTEFLAAVEVKNINYLLVLNCLFTTDFWISNARQVWIQGFPGLTGNGSHKWDFQGAQPRPNGLTKTVIWPVSTYIDGEIITAAAGGNTEIEAVATYINTTKNQGTVIDNNCVLDLTTGSWFRGKGRVENGGTLEISGGGSYSISSWTFIPGSGVKLRGTAAEYPYTATVPADWGGTSPTSVLDALDRLAKHVGPVP